MKITRIIVYLATSVALLILASLVGTWVANPLLPLILLAIGLGFAAIGITAILSRR